MEISVLDFAGDGDDFAVLPFFFDGKPVEGTFWGITLRCAGSMRFRWNEKNEGRGRILGKILKKIDRFSCSGSCVGERGECDCRKSFVPVELIHSKTVVEAKSAGDTAGIQADGIVTKNRFLVPTVTVADCVPIFLFDTESGAIGAFHSGWRGTGIAAEGVSKMKELFSSVPEKICAAIGPHIGSCCYSVGGERADFFSRNFGEECVERGEDGGLTLSLTKANLNVLLGAGILPENIVVSTDCTCCSRFSGGDFAFGSFRREAAFLPENMGADERSRKMTVQAAFAFRES